MSLEKSRHRSKFDRTILIPKTIDHNFTSKNIIDKFKRMMSNGSTALPVLKKALLMRPVFPKSTIRLFFIAALLFARFVFSEQPEHGAQNESSKTALIFGITGQDGAYLTEFLLEKNYTVHGIKRRSSSPNTSRIDSYYTRYYADLPANEQRFFLHYGDLTDSASITRLIQQIQPDEIYNLGAQSHVKVSFDLPAYTAEVDGIGALYILEAIRLLGLTDKTKFYQASTSELYGLVQETPQKESTPFYPRSPYAAAKLYAYWITVNYREAYNIFACNGILFNHESPHRGETFVTRKITLAACRQFCGDPSILYLGNLDAKRDWGYAKDYVEAMWLMLQHKDPTDFVIATGKSHSVREFVELTYKQLGIPIEWQGSGVDERGIDPSTGKVLVQVNPRYYRPTEVEFLLGDCTKAKQLLGWSPKTGIEELIRMMVSADLKKAKQEIALSEIGE